MQIKSTSTVRQNFQDIIDRVHYTKTPLIVSKNNKPWVMVQPLPEDDKDLESIIKKKDKRQ